LVTKLEATVKHREQGACVRRCQSGP
jgi:hypothetical protein